MAAGRRGGAAVDFWELEPIRYSETEATDRMAKLSANLGNGSGEIEGETDLEKLRSVLRILEIPVESQMLVFPRRVSRTR